MTAQARSLGSVTDAGIGSLECRVAVNWIPIGNGAPHRFWLLNQMAELDWAIRR